MNKIDELEFLLELQALSIGVSTHDNIEINCKAFEAHEKKTELTSLVGINVNKTDWEKAGKYIENLLYCSKMSGEINDIIVAKFKEAIQERIQTIRKEVRENLGITEGEWGNKEEKRLEEHQEIGGNTQ